jgi:2-keto-4-pentenoate hydratase/2-oxohepta-3-ene-1,7-dioic acid hydratase in catechol pathway
VFVACAALAAQAAPPSLAPPERALTVAFAERGGAREAFLVAGVDADGLEAIPLGTGDPFAALAARSDAALAALLREGARTRLPLDALLPVLESAHHIAGGANYPEHGAEVDVHAPFLFPKLVTPTSSQQPLAMQPGWLLDYEVEIAVVFDRDIRDEADLAAARAGVFVVNDLTERAQLTLEADLSTPGVGGGFANAKGKPGFLPTGPFLVVPGDWRAFVRDCEIRLSVNGSERQRARGGEMIWSVDELVRRALALAGEPLFEHEGRRVALAPAGIPRGTAILTGTPGGVAFSMPGTGFIAAGAARWLVSGWFLEEGAEAYVRRRWVEELRKSGAFLRPGDRVIAEGAGLGAIVTAIQAPATSPGG